MSTPSSASRASQVWQERLSSNWGWAIAVVGQLDLVFSVVFVSIVCNVRELCTSGHHFRLMLIILALNTYHTVRVMGVVCCQPPKAKRVAKWFIVNVLKFLVYISLYVYGCVVSDYTWLVVGPGFAFIYAIPLAIAFNAVRVTVGGNPLQLASNNRPASGHHVTINLGHVTNNPRSNAASTLRPNTTNTQRDQGANNPRSNAASNQRAHQRANTTYNEAADPPPSYSKVERASTAEGAAASIETM